MISEEREVKGFIYEKRYHFREVIRFQVVKGSGVNGYTLGSVRSTTTNQTTGLFEREHGGRCEKIVINQ